MSGAPSLIASKPGIALGLYRGCASLVQAAPNPQIPQAMTSERKRHARLAISAIFLVNGMVLATWVSRIPTITEKLDLGSGATGTALMAIAAGSMIAFPIVGRLLLRRS